MWSLAYVMMLCVLLTKGRFTEAAAFVRQYPTKATTTRGFPHHRRRRATTTTDPIIHCCPYRSSSSSSSSLWLSSDYSTTDYDNFVVGYGSIMCNVSRSITCPDLVSAPAIPVLVRNTERIWSKRSIRSMTAMGIRLVEGASCTGIMIPVNDDELLKFDEREAGYDRVRVPTKNIERVPFLNDDYYATKDEFGILDNLLLGDVSEGKEDDSSMNNDKNVWIYKPKELRFPTTEKPIVQTYVDTILRGCLDISEEFALDFLSTTRGWSTMDFGETSTTSNKSRDNNRFLLEKGQVHWVNDRLDPIYPRSDQDWVMENADKMDRLLQKYRRKEYPYRKATIHNQLRQ